MERLKLLLFSSILIFLALLFIPSCSTYQAQKEPAKGVYHLVKQGETAYSIARAYNIKLSDLAKINDIDDPAMIKEGRVLFIPEAKHVIDDVMNYVKDMNTKAKADIAEKAAGSPKNISGENGKIPKEATPTGGDKKIEALAESQDQIKPQKITSPEETKPPESIIAVKTPTGKIDPKSRVKPLAEQKEENKLEEKIFIWPVYGKVKTRFGIQPNKPYHNNSWIKIVCPVGTQVKAAASGTVIFSTSLEKFGETVIIRHQNNFTTVYTHLKKRYVKADQSVKKREAIALVGEKDESGAAYINFEVRVKGKAHDPLFFLP